MNNIFPSSFFFFCIRTEGGGKREKKVRFSLFSSLFPKKKIHVAGWLSCVRPSEHEEGEDVAWSMVRHNVSDVIKYWPEFCYIQTFFLPSRDLLGRCGVSTTTTSWWKWKTYRIPQQWRCWCKIFENNIKSSKLTFSFGHSHRRSMLHFFFWFFFFILFNFTDKLFGLARELKTETICSREWRGKFCVESEIKARSRAEQHCFATTKLYRSWILCALFFFVHLIHSPPHWALWLIVFVWVWKVASKSIKMSDQSVAFCSCRLSQ